MVEVFTESCDAKLKVVALESGGSEVERAACEVAINSVRKRYYCCLAIKKKPFVQ